MAKPSETIVKAGYDGKEVIDIAGRVIKLRKPSLLDSYDLMSAMGDQAKNSACFSMAIATLYVGMIDGVVYQCPKTYLEMRAMLQRLDDHGFTAINECLAKYDSVKSEKEATENVKK